METIISRTEFNTACDTINDVSGTDTIVRCVENDASRMFPSDPYLEYLNWLQQYIRLDADFMLMPVDIRFNLDVKAIVDLLEPDGSLYLEEYRTFLKDRTQIMNAINLVFGMAWIFSDHVKEAIRRKRQQRHE